MMVTRCCNKKVNCRGEEIMDVGVKMSHLKSVRSLVEIKFWFFCEVDYLPLSLKIGSILKKSVFVSW